MFALGIYDKLTPGAADRRPAHRRHRHDRRRRHGRADRRHPAEDDRRPRRRRDGLLRPEGQLRRGRASRARRAAPGAARTRCATRPTRSRRSRKAGDAARLPTCPRGLTEDGRGSVVEGGAERVGEPGRQVVAGQHRAARCRGCGSAGRRPAPRRAARPRRGAPPAAAGARRRPAGSRPGRRGRSPSTVGGSMSRSTTSAAPTTSSGQASWWSSSSSVTALGQLVLLDGRPRRGRVRAERLGECGLVREQLAVSTSAKTRQGWSQPEAAACRSMSSRTAVSGSGAGGKRGGHGTHPGASPRRHGGVSNRPPLAHR